jgi:hypothetical protein
MPGAPSFVPAVGRKGWETEILNLRSVPSYKSWVPHPLCRQFGAKGGRPQISN